MVRRERDGPAGGDAFAFVRRVERAFASILIAAGNGAADAVTRAKRWIWAFFFAADERAVALVGAVP